MSGIYVITNLVNRKVYVGQAIDFKARWQNHKARLRNGSHENQHLQRSWNKYRESNFVFEIVEECQIEILGVRERYWIRHFNSIVATSGYNKEIPTESGGKRMSDESRTKMKKSHTGQKLGVEHRRRIGEGHTGIVYSATRDRKISDAKSKPFSLLSPNKEVITGVNLKKFCKDNGLSAGNICQVVNGKRKAHKGWARPI